MASITPTGRHPLVKGAAHSRKRFLEFKLELVQREAPRRKLKLEPQPV
jgi:hypothetical protein